MSEDRRRQSSAVQEHAAMSLVVQGYYAILDVKGTSVDGAGVLAHAGRLLRAGPCCLQLRAKQLCTGSFCRLAHEVKSLCAASGVPFCINDRLDVALAVSADIVHLGQNDLSLSDAVRVRNAVAAGRLHIAISTHDLDEALAAVAGGADHIGFGPIFPTQSKADANPAVGLSVLSAVTARLKIPVVAIGGIDLDNVAEVAKAGASAAAVIAAVDKAADPTAAGQLIGSAFATNARAQSPALRLRPA
jgi:thiamine-phosphate pyrophosphorylase